MAGTGPNPTRVACPLGMAARWGAARRGPADDGPLGSDPSWPAGMTARCARPVGAHASPGPRASPTRRGVPARPVPGES